MAEKISIWDRNILKIAAIDAIKKLSPLNQLRNPIIFIVYACAILATGILLYSTVVVHETPTPFIFIVTSWIWATVLFSNFAEALAEGRGKAQANALRQTGREIKAKKLSKPNINARIKKISARNLKINDIALVEANDFIPSDGEVIEGVASVNESAITGESAPVIRESGSDRSSVTGGTQVLSDWIIIRITANPGETFLDDMVNLIESAKRQKTPNELSLTILLAALSLVFLFVSVSLVPFSVFASKIIPSNIVSPIILIVLFVCLVPTTIGGLLSAIGIAGMDRMIQANVIALSGRAVEAAGDIDILILDKTGTVTLGNRQATKFIPDKGVDIAKLANAAQLASLADETPEGRSIVVLAKTKYGLRGRDINELGATFSPFTAQTRMSGATINGSKIQKGAKDAVFKYIKDNNGTVSKYIESKADHIAKRGGTPLVVTEDNKILGVIYLKDIVKGGIRKRFAKLRAMGIKTIMVTGDNPLTAAAIAAEAGVDDFLANADPEDKLKLIRKMQAEGHLVAMTGDGTNDAPALAQADVAVAMHTGTQAAKEAGNLVDLDSNPTKILEVVEIGKQLLITRGSLTTFSITTDIAKYFAIIPATFATTYPTLDALNIMHLASPSSAILSTVIFNSLLIAFMIPLSLQGVKYRHVSAIELLRTNVFVYGVGGLILPFIGIKLIDFIITVLNISIF